VVGDHDHLLLIRQIDTDDRVPGRNQDPQPGEPRVAVAITPGHTATVTHERPPPAMGHQARQAHQEDVPTSCIDTQNVFLCRRPGVALRDERPGAEQSPIADEALQRSASVLPMMPGMPERRTHDYLRNGVTTLFAAFDTATGDVITSIHRRHRAIEFKKFLTKIDQTVPGDLDVHLIIDNYGTHKTPAITAWLARHPRFHMHFTPTYSSWINQVERWFGLLTDKKIRRGTHKSVQALEADIRAWAADWNTNPKPFTWTKTAEEILESLQRLCQRISGAAH
jgi:transposase